MVGTNGFSGINVNAFRKLYSADITATGALTASTPAISPPTGYINVMDAAMRLNSVANNEENVSARGLAFLFYGTGDADDLFHFRLESFTELLVSSPDSATGSNGIVEYRPYLIASSATAVLSTLTGVSGGIGTGYKYSDDFGTVTSGAILTSFTDVPNFKLITHQPDDNSVAALLYVPDFFLMFRGFRLQLSCDSGTTGVESINALWAPVN